MKAFYLICLLSLLISGCTIGSVPLKKTETPLPIDPTLIPTVAGPPILVPSPTPMHLSTSRPNPTQTLDPVSGVYTAWQLDQLYEASLRYVAPSDDEAVKVALSLKFVKGADVSNMCGPLAMAILRSAGLVPATVDLHDFWLLNPRLPDARAVLARVFPEPEYADYPIDQPTNEFDFRKFPLKAGDFLYIYAGVQGSFEHMLTVTRVDGAGRAYTVTNLHTDSYHFAIREVVLYDPTQPGVGQFYEWTKTANYRLGQTGFGGFEIWRRMAPLP